MGTIILGGTTFDIFGEFLTDDAGPPIVQSATNYFKASLNISAWTSASSSDKQKSLIEATRLLDKQKWKGVVTTPGQPLAWPRSGVTDQEGVAVPDTDVPDGIIFGTYELAASLLADAVLKASTNSGSNTKRQKNRDKVGDLETESETEYFVPTASGRASAGRFPTLVQEYIRPFLPSLSAGAIVSGTGVCSNELVSDFTYNNNGLN